jgi:hypothetical protein
VSIRDDVIIQADRIEVVPAEGGFVWRFVSTNGRIRANNEVFATRSSAVRAVKGVVTQVGLMLGVAPAFSSTRVGAKTVLTVEAGLAL